jgi:hypothetical protein
VSGDTHLNSFTFWEKVLSLVAAVNGRHHKGILGYRLSLIGHFYLSAVGCVRIISLSHLRIVVKVVAGAVLLSCFVFLILGF